jgi:hypothetical protein
VAETNSCPHSEQTTEPSDFSIGWNRLLVTLHTRSSGPTILEANALSVELDLTPNALKKGDCPQGACPKSRLLGRTH